MADGELPPVKERIDIPYATQKTDTGLTVNILKMLHNQVFYLGSCYYFKIYIFVLART